MAVNQVTNKIYVRSGSQTAVTVIDGSTNALTQIPISSFASSVAVNSNTNKVYILLADAADGLIVADGTTNNTTTIPGIGGSSLAVNSATNKIYITNNPTGVTVVDGATNTTTSLPGITGSSVVVNTATNKLYVSNPVANQMTVIDGESNNATALASGTGGSSFDVDTIANKIYVTNGAAHSVTVIDGATNGTTSVPLLSAPATIAVNSLTHKIYVGYLGEAQAGLLGTVTVIDGPTNATSVVPLALIPCQMAVNPLTNKIYVLDFISWGLGIIDGITNTVTSMPTPPGPLSLAINPLTSKIYLGFTPNHVIAYDVSGALQFVPVTPCRIADTRLADGPFGGPELAAGAERDFVIPNGACGIPPNVAAYSLNVTAVPDKGLGFLTAFPAGFPLPPISTLNSDGRVKANAAIVASGNNGAVGVYASDPTHVVLDINGYFVAGNSAALNFYPTAPCRVADTRLANGALGGPLLGAGTSRSFPVLSSSCGIPSAAQAYSLNFTVVPRSSLSYLTVWPAGQSQPLVSTLNANTIAANAAIVPAGASGSINVYASNDTDVIIDVNGYFAAPSSGGLSLYIVTPWRTKDTRIAPGVINGVSALTVSSDLSYLNAPTAQAFVLNATVVPSNDLSFLTFWPDGQSQPTVSTLNAPDGAITSNMAIVPGTGGVIDSFVTNPTQLILDLSAYFAP